MGQLIEKKGKAIEEQHYTPAQLAKLWGFSEHSIRRLFRDEEGVMLLIRPEKMHKRGYSTLRIPESVAERVYGALLVLGKARRITSIADAPPAEKRQTA